MTTAELSAALEMDSGGVSDAISRARKRMKTKRIYVAEWVRPSPDMRSVAVWAAGSREDAKVTRLSAKAVEKQRIADRMRQERETFHRVAALGSNPWRTCIVQVAA
ncbi:hypothetical protein [Burkholderia cepacia]|uniref:hypothetical protein n=1 Tax=Burkholderia cepacia TaxID=292 RepID=UPI0012D89731|nr:hypothetical protein [Burkholderia cepacia]